jgi:four helix bundle protein
MAQQRLMDIAIAFSEHVILISRHLENLRFPDMSRQLMRSGLAIGALAAEASEAESADDFIHKMKIAAKEAKETRYWLEVSRRNVQVDPNVFDQLTSMQKILAKSIHTATLNRDANLIKKQNKTGRS